MNGGLPGGTGLNHSRLIPGAPVLPSGQTAATGGQGMLPGSLLGRDVAQVPISQPVPSGPGASLSLGGTNFPTGTAAGAPATASGAGRKLANLREPRGASFLRLAFAALFLLGFLGLVGFFLKDYLPPSVLSLFQKADTEESGIVAHSSAPITPSAMPEPPSVPGDTATEQQAGQGITSASTPPETAPRPMGFDPLETSPPKTAAALPAEEETITKPAGMVAGPDADKSESAPASSQTLEERPAQAVTQTPDTNARNTLPMTGQPALTTGSADDETIPQEARPAVDAIKQFLAATTLEERLRYTLGAEVMKPLMERYYGRASEGPVTVDRVQFVRLDPNPELGSGRHCILSLESKTWQFPVPVMLEEEPDGFKVDWLAFVEFKDRLLEKFFQTYQEGPMRFHVGIMRHHYFEDGVPNADRKDAFRINAAPPNSFQGYAFLEKDTELAKELRTRMPWETHVWAIVDLEWKKLGSQQWVELHGVPQMHWHPLPAGPRPISTSQKPPPEQASATRVKPGMSNGKSSLPPPGISKNGVGSAKSEPTPPGIRKSTPGLPDTIKRPLPMGR